jgi:hypothetical protein
LYVENPDESIEMWSSTQAVVTLDERPLVAVLRPADGVAPGERVDLVISGVD